MKLRLRSLESKETLRIEVPDACSLHQLGQTLSLTISSSSSSSSLHFSLNREEELFASSPQDSLHSLGITSGDLIYYSANPNAFSPQTPGSISSVQENLTIQEPKSKESDFSQKIETLGTNSPNTEIPIRDSSEREPRYIQVSDINFQEPKSKESEVSQASQILGLNSANQETPFQHFSVDESESADSDMSETNIEEQSSVVSNNQIEQTQETQLFSGTENVDTDDGSTDVPGKKFSEPYFLRRVLREELGDDGGDHKLLVIAVHAVLLESGFIGFDSVSGMRVDRFHLSDEWPSMAFTMSLCYTLPELLDNGSHGSNGTESVVLKFQSLGHFVNVYGSLTNGGSGLHRVSLNEYRFAPTIDLVWANCDKNDSMDDKDVSSNSYSYPENEIFEFWKIVKDGLALPLLIDLCDKTNLMLPPCLMRLPTELKLKILGSLPAVDIARMGCVCSDMRYLASNNDVWKQKFVEEVGSVTRAQGMVRWKERFVSYWESKKRKNLSAARREFHRIDRPFFYPIRRDPNPFGVPLIIGGDYDLFPALAIHPPFGQPGQTFPRFQSRRNVAPRCNRGGFNTR